MKQMREEASKNPDPSERRVFREMVFVRWIREDAPAALELAQTCDEGRIKGLFAKYWSLADPQGGWGHYEKFGSCAQRQ